MPGVYLHIPFCKQACHYCNFHFSTSLKLKEELCNALVREAELTAAFLDGAELTSIYFGGGTPSLLSAVELQSLIDAIARWHPVRGDAEVTLEANPDDLTADYLSALSDTAVNRLSIGVQSFTDAELKFMNRAHTAGEASRCLELALAAGFTNLTVDLIYGSPVSSGADWAEAIARVVGLGIPHISAYALTVEPRTALAHFVNHGMCAPVDEAVAASRMEYLMEQMECHGYEHYEISNFALPGHRAVHNSSYWAGEPYLGLGPSAHSFDGHLTRHWNTANNPGYIRAIVEGRLPCEQETLQLRDRYNEYVMTGLRTSRGCSVQQIALLGRDFEQVFLEGIRGWVDQGLARFDSGSVCLTRSGRLLADRIASDLFVTD